MIRTKDMILGEPNDPNTVIATGTLEVGKLVVGAGNKGIKTIDLEPNSLLYADRGGDLRYLNYANQRNKYIGTDASGELVLIPRGGSSGLIYKLDSDNFKMTKGFSGSVIANGYTESYTTSGSLFKSFKLTSIPTGSLTNDKTGYACIKFTEPLVVSEPKTVVITSTVSIKYGGDVEYEDPRFFGKVDNLRLITSDFDTFNGFNEYVSLSSNSIHNTAWCSSEMQLPSGTYYGLAFNMVFGTLNSSPSYPTGEYRVGASLVIVEVT